jgi:1-acyl-sn-glycerol-3-phosphate acyltransferase
MSGNTGKSSGNDEKIFVDHRGTEPEHGSFSTYLVLAHTLSASARIAARSMAGQLTPERTDALIDRWCDHIFRISKLTLKARGITAAYAGAPAVLLSNHVSLLDTPCVLRTWPGRVRMISKIELSRVPIFGRALKDAGNVFVDRENLQKAIEQLEDAKRVVESGTSLWVAAEGRRSRDGRLHTFKKGPFHVAVDVQRPIVPTFIQGTLDAIPSDQWGSVTGQTVIVSYGEPIPTEGATKEDIPALQEKTRASMLSMARAAGARDDIDAAQEDDTGAASPTAT